MLVQTHTVHETEYDFSVQMYAQLAVSSVNRVRHSLVFHFKTMTAGYGDDCLYESCTGPEHKFVEI